MMQTKDIVQLLGIKENKIKDYIRNHVFTPENPSINGSRINYTDHDVEELKRLMVLRSTGLTVKDLQEIQEFPDLLETVLLKRMENMTRTRNTKSDCLSLAEALLLQIRNQVPISYNRFWELIQMKKLTETDYDHFLLNFREATLLRNIRLESHDVTEK